jgi:antitoxin component YwqK of YwqJK toxin-antitoxin module
MNIKIILFAFFFTNLNLCAQKLTKEEIVSFIENHDSKQKLSINIMDNVKFTKHDIIKPNHNKTEYAKYISHQYLGNGVWEVKFNLKTFGENISTRYKTNRVCELNGEYAVYLYESSTSKYYYPVFKKEVEDSYNIFDVLVVGKYYGLRKIKHQERIIDHTNKLVHITNYIKDNILDGTKTTRELNNENKIFAYENYVLGFPSGDFYEINKTTGLYSLKIKNFKQGDLYKAVKYVYYNSGKLSSETNLTFDSYTYDNEINYSYSNDGIETQYFENSIIKSITNYKKGLKNGLEETYHTNGKLISKENYNKNTKTCYCEYRDTFGILTYEIESLIYFDGKSKGFYNGLYKNYYKTGKMKSKGNYHQGNKYGMWTYYRTNGNRNYEEILINEKRNGLYSTYHLNDVLCYEELYENGKYIKTINGKDLDGTLILNNGNGKIKVYYDNGKIKQISEFQNGLRHGKSIWYYENGIIDSEIEYKEKLRWNVFTINDKLGNKLNMGTLKNGNGTLNIYNDDGKITIKYLFENGIEIIKDVIKDNGSQWFLEIHELNAKNILKSYPEYYNDDVFRVKYGDSSHLVKIHKSIETRRPGSNWVKQVDEFYPNNKKKLLVNGNNLTYYYPNGNVLMESFFNERGSPTNTWVMYDENRNIKRKYHFINGNSDYSVVDLKSNGDTLFYIGFESGRVNMFNHYETIYLYSPNANFPIFISSKSNYLGCNIDGRVLYKTTNKDYKVIKGVSYLKNGEVYFDIDLIKQQ